MKVFLDDRRPAPDNTWVLVKSPSAAISLLETGEVELISFDHDLGYDGDIELTGNQVLLWVEEAVALRGFEPPKMLVHSSEPSRPRETASRNRSDQPESSPERLRQGWRRRHTTTLINRTTPGLSLARSAVGSLVPTRTPKTTGESSQTGRASFLCSALSAGGGSSVVPGRRVSSGTDVLRGCVREHGGEGVAPWMEEVLRP